MIGHLSLIEALMSTSASSG